MVVEKILVFSWNAIDYTARVKPFSLEDFLMFGYNQMLESMLIVPVVGEANLNSFISRGGIQIEEKSGGAFERGP